ncbi:MAG: bifunctional phosphopantothenoylcysteine decarboxylase/phosphopantothenate--cysteine ligase CoaBC [Bacteroidales bacterium]|nr:bifunctional phosphopantothenoylcysteine decarboxylase/phosphopantothenate--cysteine ligase CoaBC [Bacteroidales bacterium]
MLKGKKIIVGITGGIAAYKIPLLVRLLKKEGAEVQVVMTSFAKEFVTPLTLATVSGRPVLTDFFDKGDGTWNSHVDLGLWADAMIIAPLTANSMAKMSVGMADNFLMTLVLSARCPILFAPSMDFDMFQHPTTTENIKKLQLLGYHYIEPASGELASGLTGPGRLKEPEELLAEISFFFEQGLILRGKKILISAGPTYEPIDPVRFIGNRSSGKMGLALAKAFSAKGAEVELVLGPVSLKVDLPGIHVVPVNTAEEMYHACTKAFEKVDIAVMTAAVADFTPVNVASEKIKKEKGIEKIELKPTPDILASLGKAKRDNQILVGFALETDDEFSNAKKKLERKNLDMIVLNSLKDEGAGFGVDTNKITVLKKDGTSSSFPLKTKDSIAFDILSEIENLIGGMP